MPKTTEQLARLFAAGGVDAIELAADALLTPQRRLREIARVQTELQEALSGGRDVAVYTSRGLLTGQDAEQSLRIGTEISAALRAIW